MPELCLGTVQFGLPYGITNYSGRVAIDEVRHILKVASESGIQLLDTAQSYGASESILGDCWPASRPRRLISKLSPVGTPDSWEIDFQNSLERLHVHALDGFLAHRASALVETRGRQLLDWMNSLRDRGLVERIGVSIYDASELDQLPLDQIQIVQLPLSLYDQRLLQSGTVKELVGRGIAVHARSIFLQGLVLQRPEEWPGFLSPEFRVHHGECIRLLEEHRLNLLEAAIAFARECSDLEAVLVGVLKASELSQIVHAWQKESTTDLMCMNQLAWSKRTDLDPRCWLTR